MEVCDHKISIGNVNVNAYGSQHKAGQSAHRKQPDKTKGIEHRSGVGDGTLVESGSPVKDFDGGGNSHGEAQKRKDHRGIERNAGDEHVMCPHQESKDRDGYARQSDKLVAEDALAGRARNELADHAHRRQDHDVDRGMRVEPEQVLEQERVAAKRGIENAKMEEALDSHEYDGDGDYRRAENHDQTGSVVGPDEERQAVPGEAGGAHAVNGNDEIESGKDGRETRDEDRQSSLNDVRVGATRAVRGIEVRAGLDTPRRHAHQHTRV